MSVRRPSESEAAPPILGTGTFARGRMLSRGGNGAARCSDSPGRRRVRSQGSQGSSVLAGRELAPYQRHQRLLGWKLTSLERRKETIRLLESGVLGHGATRLGRPVTITRDVRALAVGFALDLDAPLSELSLHDSASSSYSGMRRGVATVERSPNR